MRRLFVPCVILLAVTVAVVGGAVRGTLLNDDDPYFIKGDDGNIYKAEWYGGSTLFFEGDEVILTDSYGMEKMIDDTSDETADVWVEEISEQYRLPRLRLPSSSNLTPPPPAHYFSTAAPTPTPKLTPAPTPSRDYSGVKWPDGSMLIHPEHFVKAPVIHVAPDDKLELRSAPRETSPAVAEIPFR
jgi:hypothetical protein